MELLWLARALHVLAIILWIGGVAFVTLVVLPALDDFPLDRQLTEFARYERRFTGIARLATVLAGLSGFYMLENLGLWGRFGEAAFWWMHAMIAVWTLFTLLLFVIEPLFFHAFLQRLEAGQPGRAVTVMRRGHRVLLGLSLLTAAGAVAGAHGWVPAF
ncbi:MAG: hypothetical protein ACM3X0_10615 [Bacteroidota bacterium]